MTKAKKTSSYSIDYEVHKKAKENNIDISGTLEEALLMKLNDPALIDQLERERKEYLAKARLIKHKIDGLRELQARQEAVFGDKNARLETAMKTVYKVVDNEGSIDEDRIAFIAKNNGLLSNELMDEYILRGADNPG